jgi:hypothetical protein
VLSRLGWPGDGVRRPPARPATERSPAAAYPSDGHRRIPPLPGAGAAATSASCAWWSSRAVGASAKHVYCATCCTHPAGRYGPERTSAPQHPADRYWRPDGVVDVRATMGKRAALRALLSQVGDPDELEQRIHAPRAGDMHEHIVDRERSGTLNPSASGLKRRCRCSSEITEAAQASLERPWRRRHQTWCPGGQDGVGEAAYGLGGRAGRRGSRGPAGRPSGHSRTGLRQVAALDDPAGVESTRSAAQARVAISTCA